MNATELLYLQIENRQGNFSLDEIREEVADWIGVFRYRSSFNFHLEMARIYFQDDAHSVALIDAYLGELNNEGK
jgi:hypothetical protein